MTAKGHIIWERQTRESWLQQLRADIPGFTESSIRKKVEEDIYSNSFPFPTDIQNEGLIEKCYGKQDSWKVGTRITSQDPGVLKSNLHLALDNGLEYLHCILPENCSTNDLNQILEGVFLEMIISRWTLPLHTDRTAILEILQKKADSSTLFIDGDSPQSNEMTDRGLSLSYTLPPFESGKWLEALTRLLLDFRNSGSLPSGILLDLRLHDDFLLSMASIRALKLLLNKIWQLNDLTIPFYIEAGPSPDCLSVNVYHNIIKESSISLSAILSGIDFLIVSSPDIHSPLQKLSWLRTSLHLQHILKHEARLENLKDYMAGSYYIEDLTEQIASKLWRGLQETLAYV